MRDEHVFALASRYDAYAEAPTVLHDVPEDYGPESGPTVVSAVAEGVLLEWDGGEDTPARTPAYGRRPVVPLTAADIPAAWTPAPAPPRTARPARNVYADDARRHPGMDDAAVALLAVWTTAAFFGTLALGVATLARLLAG